MDIESYQLFCYAVEEKSISQAAKKAFISQPAATKKIQQLEEHYSTLLFERERGTLILTEAGQRLYEHAKLIIREYLDSIETIDMLHNRKRRTLRIGSSFTLGEYILPEIISAYSNPDIDIKLSISNTPNMIDDLLEKKIDVAFVEGVTRDFNVNLDKTVLCEDEIILIVGPNHKWVKEGRIRPFELLNDRMIMREEVSGTRKIVEQALSEKIKLNQLQSTLELNTTQAIKNAVHSGLGYAFLSRFAVRMELNVGYLHEINVYDIEIKRPLWVFKRFDRFANEAVEEFSEFACKYMERYN